jgi:hypothetical protein
MGILTEDFGAAPEDGLSPTCRRPRAGGHHGQHGPHRIFGVAADAIVSR